MKYYAGIFPVILISILAPILILLVLDHLFDIFNNKRKRISFVASSFFLFLLFAFFAYINDYNRARPEAKNYLVGNENVNVSKTSFGYLFDGKSKNRAIIFYPGAKVDTTAYAPMLFEIAERGIDCFLIDMPLRLAILGENKADEILAQYKYEEYYMMGHSLGGVVASKYAHDHYETICGLILLASYTQNTIYHNIQTISMYGSNDGVLDKEAYNQNKINFPINVEEYIIEGGNHTQFGCYDLQLGDNEATITYEEQKKITIDKIFEIFGDEEEYDPSL